jgi:hypothetical protein
MNTLSNASLQERVNSLRKLHAGHQSWTDSCSDELAHKIRNCQVIRTSRCRAVMLGCNGGLLCSIQW